MSKIKFLRSKHLTSDDECPALPKPNQIRIYSMLFCPFAQRVILVAIAKKIPIEIVNVNVTVRPDWLLKKYPGGKVPLLESVDGIISESLTISEYLDQLPSSTTSLMSSNPFIRAQNKNMAEQFQEVISNLITLFFGPQITEPLEAQRLLQELEIKIARLENELKRRETKYFEGDSNPGMLDYMYWPFVERFPILAMLYQKMAPEFDFGWAKYPTWNQWITHMKMDEAVRQTMIGLEDHYKYISGRRAGNIDYDFLSVE